MILRHRRLTVLFTGLVIAGLFCGERIAGDDKKPPATSKTEQPVSPQGAKEGKKPSKKPALKQKEELSELQKVMRKKLVWSQQMLEGLAIEDFKRIKKNADELGKLTESEQWRVSTDERYRQLSRDLRTKASQASRMADQSNLDGAALSYVQITISCVECHKWVREVLIADTDLKDIGRSVKLPSTR